jgi:group I intron endonuclease
MYYLVYLTRNLVNNKIYVGVHSTWNLDDGYLGSGDKLKLAVKKYGKENFNRIILHYCYNEQQAYEIESQIVDTYFINRKDTYNIVLGGSIPSSRKGKSMSTYSRLQISKSLSGRKGRQWTALDCSVHSVKMKSIMSNPITKEKCSLAKKGKPGNKHTKESKAKISYIQSHLSEEQLQRKSKAKQGNKNGMYGKKWYNNGISSSTFIPDQEPVGWILGRKFN